MLVEGSGWGVQSLGSSLAARGSTSCFLSTARAAWMAMKTCPSASLVLAQEGRS